MGGEGAGYGGGERPYDDQAKELAMENFGISVDDMGLAFMESKKDCTCCFGYVNNCQGEACKNLGICRCIVEDEDDADGQ